MTVQQSSTLSVCLPGPDSTFSNLCNCGEPIALKMFSDIAETLAPVSITNELLCHQL